MNDDENKSFEMLGYVLIYCAIVVSVLVLGAIAMWG